MAVYVAHLPIVGLWRPASIMIARRLTCAVHGRETRVLEGNGCRARRLHTCSDEGRARSPPKASAHNRETQRQMPVLLQAGGWTPVGR